MAGNVMTLAEAPVRAWTKALAGLGRGPRAYLRGLTRARTGQVVQQGPLAGMHYIDGAIESAYIPKLLGIYERELWPVVASLDATEFRTLVNVGAGEGYYAVGLARRHSDIRVVAFEALEAGRAAIVRMAHLNRVADRIAVRGCCDLAALQAALHEDPTAIVICDAEGAELDLLRPDVVPELQRARVLVELHDCLRPGISAAMRQRFGASHRLTVFKQQERRAADFPYVTWITRLLPTRYLEWAVNEGRRGPMSWMWMTPRWEPS